MSIPDVARLQFTVLSIRPRILCPTQSMPHVLVSEGGHSVLCQVLYSSVATGALCEDQMRDLVEHARLRNAELSITGALIHFPSSRDIFQVLEGRRRDIDRLMRKIHADRRHSRIDVLYMSAIDTRSFAAWSMGFINAESADRAAARGKSGALRHGIASLRLIRAKATELRALRAGRDSAPAQPTLD